MAQIDLELAVPPENPWLRFAGMWADDPTWDDFINELATYRQAVERTDTEA